MIPLGLVGRKFLAAVLAVVHDAIIVSLEMVLENFTSGKCFRTVITLEVTFLRKRIGWERSIYEVRESITRPENVMAIFVQSNDILVFETRDDDLTLL